MSNKEKLLNKKQSITITILLIIISFGLFYSFFFSVGEREFRIDETTLQNKIKDKLPIVTTKSIDIIFKKENVDFTFVITDIEFDLEENSIQSVTKFDFLAFNRTIKGIASSSGKIAFKDETNEFFYEPSDLKIDLELNKVMNDMKEHILGKNEDTLFSKIKRKTLSIVSKEEDFNFIEKKIENILSKSITKRLSNNPVYSLHEYNDLENIVSIGLKNIRTTKDGIIVLIDFKQYGLVIMQYMLFAMFILLMLYIIIKYPKNVLEVLGEIIVLPFYVFSLMG
jgi:hypothetical protein